jgi:hypothetical protein
MNIYASSKISDLKTKLSKESKESVNHFYIYNLEKEKRWKLEKELGDLKIKIQKESFNKALRDYKKLI